MANSQQSQYSKQSLPKVINAPDSPSVLKHTQSQGEVGETFITEMTGSNAPLRSLSIMDKTGNFRQS
jgi:hypothetical protein